MKRLFALAFATLLVCAPGQLWAGVFSRDWKTPGDGLLTYDDVNQREWLDLSVSRLEQFPMPQVDNVIAQLVPGGLFEGFTFAKRPDVIGFAQSAGITTTTWSFPVNESSTRALISLLGRTFEAPTTIDSIGFLNEIDGATRAGADFFVQLKSPNGEGSIAGLDLSSSNDLLGFPSTGLMLYRAVPEPTNAVLSMCALAGYFLSAMRRPFAPGVK